MEPGVDHCHVGWVEGPNPIHYGLRLRPQIRLPQAAYRSPRQEVESSVPRRQAWRRVERTT